MAKASAQRAPAHEPPPAPAHAPDAKNGRPREPEISPFVRDAIREKAARELAALDTRAEAIAAVTKAKADVLALIEATNAASTALTASADVTVGVPAKLKRLKKALEEASSVVDQLAEAVGADGDRAAEVGERRDEIERALEAAGIARDDLGSSEPTAD